MGPVTWTRIGCIGNSGWAAFVTTTICLKNGGGIDFLLCLKLTVGVTQGHERDGNLRYNTYKGCGDKG